MSNTNPRPFLVTDLPRQLAVKINAEPAGCWHWQGALQPNGYAYVSWEGKYRPAHRVIYERARGPIPPGMVLDHQCHDPADCRQGDACPHRSCVNPEHLRPVTRAENSLRTSRWAGERPTTCKRGHDLTAPKARTKQGACRPCARQSESDYRARRAARAAGLEVPQPDPPDYATAAEVRAWARDNGLRLPKRGALPRVVVAIWNIDHPARPYRTWHEIRSDAT